MSIKTSGIISARTTSLSKPFDTSRTEEEGGINCEKDSCRAGMVLVSPAGKIYTRF